MTTSLVPAWCANHTGNMTVYLKHYYCSKVEINLVTCQPIQSQVEMDGIRMLCEASEVVWYVAFWFSVVVGILGNALALCTIASLPATIATFYVGLLALSDLVAILVRMVIYFLSKEKLMNPTTVYWHIFPMLFDFSVSYSSWLLVLICVDRFITVRYPLLRRFHFTLRHARLAAIVMALVLFAVYFVAVRVLGYADTRMFTVRNLLYSVIPLFFIIIFIALIAIQFRIVHQKRKLLQEGAGRTLTGNGYKHTKFSLHTSFRRNQRTESTRSSPASFGESRILSSTANGHDNPTTRPNVFEDIERLENNITIMMLVTAVCFAILTIPNCVLLFTYRHAMERWNTPTARARWHVFSKTSQALTFLNLSINFLLYFLSGSKFRHQLCKLVRCRSGRRARKNENVPNKASLTLINVPSSSESYL